MKHKNKTPLDVLVSLVGWYSPTMSKVMQLAEPPNCGGSFQGNFWLWCMREGFKGKVGGTMDYPQSHGWCIHPEDKEPFTAWLVAKLKQIEN
jgi:hypothetical protein